MSPSNVSVTLTCDNPAAELIIVNSEFEPVAHGLSPLSASVPPGIYALKSKIGANVSERLESLAPRDQDYQFHLDEPEFESPMPLVNTATSREYQTSSIEQFMSTPAVPFMTGSDCALMLYVRDTSRRNLDLTEEHRDEYASNFRGLSLLDPQGKELIDFDSHSTFDADRGYVGANIELVAGPYVLAWKDGDERTCLAVNTIADWVLQIYIRLQPVSATSIKMRPDFGDAAFSYDRLGSGYSAYREDYRTMEAARQALIEQSNLKRGQLIRELLHQKFENPMLGIYACHLIMVGDQDYPENLGDFLANTASLVGPSYPDLLPLAWRYETVTGKRPDGFDPRPWAELLAAVKGPPLLTLSWDLLLECADACEVSIEALPAFSPAGNLAVSGAVLTWNERIGARTLEAQQLEGASIGAVPSAARTRRHIGRSKSKAGVSDGGAAIAESTSLWDRFRSSAWKAVSPFLTRLPDGSHAPVPRLEIKDMGIETPEAAADAARLLAAKAPWQDIARYMNRRSTREAKEFGSVSTLQRDLMMTLARAADEPEILEAINSDYISSLMRAHRVRLGTVATALRGLDLIAVSTEIIRRVRTALSSDDRSSGQGPAEPGR